MENWHMSIKSHYVDEFDQASEFDQAKEDKVKPLLYIITFIQIIIKGCMESTKAKALLITLSIILGSIFIPHFLGLLVLSLTGTIGIAWPLGAITLIIIVLVCVVIALVYLGIRDVIE